MEFGEAIANRIREIRKSKGYTQEKLAEKASMDLTAFSRIERGKNSNIRVNTLDKIIQALEIDYPTFFSFSNDSNNITRVIAKLTLLNKEDEVLEIIEKIINLKLD